RTSPWPRPTRPWRRTFWRRSGSRSEAVDRRRRLPGLAHLSPGRAALAAVVVAVALAAPPLFVELGRAPFDDPGEGQHAEVAHELLHTRDPFALTLGGVSYVDKPPLLYALMALAFAGRERPIGRWLPWPGVLLLALLGFGWWALVEWRTPGFVSYTVVDNHLLNAFAARRLPDEDVPLAAGEFLAVALLGAAPW